MFFQLVIKIKDLNLKLKKKHKNVQTYLCTSPTPNQANQKPKSEAYSREAKLFSIQVWLAPSPSTKSMLSQKLLSFPVSVEKLY